MGTRKKASAYFSKIRKNVSQFYYIKVDFKGVKLYRCVFVMRVRSGDFVCPSNPVNLSTDFVPSFIGHMTYTSRCDFVRWSESYDAVIGKQWRQEVGYFVANTIKKQQQQQKKKKKKKKTIKQTKKKLKN